MKTSTLTVLFIQTWAALSATAGVFFTNETAFVAAIQPNYYLEDFNGFTYGTPLGGTNITDIRTNNYTAPGGQGFGWTVLATNGLFSLNSALSVGVPNDPLTITFTSNTVTAIGGIVANTDTPGNLIPGTVSITTSDGGSNSVVFATATQGFLGYISTVPITAITFSASNPAPEHYITVGHFYTGTAASASPPPSINKLTLLNGSNRLDAINLPPGHLITVEGSTNLLTWTSDATVTVTNPTQTIFFPATSDIRRFFRLHL